MFIFSRPRLTYLKIWLTVIIVITVIFGFTLIIYEEWKGDQDNLLKFVPVETKLYFHLDTKLLPEDNNLPLGFVEMMTEEYLADFSRDLSIWQSQGISSLSFLIVPATDGWQTAWILSFAEGSLLPEIPDGYQSVRRDGALLIAGNDQLLDLLNSTYQGEHTSLNYSLHRYLAKRSLGFYVYYNNSSQQNLSLAADNQLAVLANFLPQGDWLAYLGRSSILIKKLTGNGFFNLPNFFNRQQQWLEIFADQSIVLYQQDLTQLWSYLQRLDKVQLLFPQIYNWEDKYHVSLSDLYSNLEGPLDLVLKVKKWDQDKVNDYEWLVRLPLNSKGQQQLQDLAGLMLGYSQPVSREVVLPDKTTGRELFVKKKDIIPQTEVINNQLVNFLYLDKNQEYFWYFDEQGKLILGNNMGLLTKYLSKAIATRPSCLTKVKTGIILNLPKIWQDKYQLKRLTIGKNSLNSSDLIICYN